MLLGKKWHRWFLRNFTISFVTVTSQNTTYFWYISIMLSICCCHLVVSRKFYMVVYNLTKHLWNCVGANQICLLLWMLGRALSLPLNMQRILICRFHMTIFVSPVWKFKLVLLSYILESTAVLHIISPL